MEWTIRLEAKTGWGEVETVEVVSIARPVLAATADDVGLSLAEAKSLLTRLQEAMVRGQVAEYLHCRRVCPDCLTFQPVKDRRQRRLQTLFGTVDVEAPRYRICRCRLPPCVDEATFSPVSELFPGRCTPELERIQAEVGSAYVVPRGRPDLGDVAACITSRPCQRPQSAPLHRSAARGRRRHASNRAGEACQARDRRRPGRCPCPFCAWVSGSAFRGDHRQGRGQGTPSPAVRVGWQRDRAPRGIGPHRPGRSRLAGKSACHGHQRW